MRKSAICIPVLLLLIAGAAGARTLTAKDIITRAADEYDRVKDYTVDAKVTVDSPGVHVPQMNLKIYYKKPDKLHLESKDGFAALPRQGVPIGNPLREMLKGSELSLAGSERAIGRDCYLVKITYRNEGRTTRARVWIDKERWVAAQMYIDPEMGPSLRLSLWYSRVGGKFWMPARSQAVVQFPSTPGNKGAGSKPEKPSTISAQFFNYKINTNLSDRIFQKKRSN